MSTSMQPCLSVVMPCYNEAATIKEILQRALESPYTRELIVVDDGSVDGTADEARSLADPRMTVVVQPFNMGKGAALRRGFLHASSPYIIVQDADLEYDPKDFEQILAPLLEDKADVVYGSRFMAGRPHRVLYFWHSVGNRLLTTASNMLTNLNLSDMETGYKAFRREVLQSLVIEEDRFGVEPEITAKVAGAGWRVYEVGISYAGRTYAEGKKIGWRDGVRALWCVVRYSGARSRVIERSARGGHGTEKLLPHEAQEELRPTLESMEAAQKYADWIFSLTEPYLGLEILEAGAGRGSMTERFVRKGRVTATELSDEFLSVLRDRFVANPDVTVVPAEDELPEERYDSAVLVNVLEHIEDDVGELRRLGLALRPGGHLLIFVPALMALYSDTDRRLGHFRRYRASHLASVVSMAGYELVELRYVNQVGALAWWLLTKQLRRSPYGGLLVRAYDRAVVPPLRRVEATRPPRFGQSLFCVARRASPDRTGNISRVKVANSYVKFSPR